MLGSEYHTGGVLHGWIGAMVCSVQMVRESVVEGDKRKDTFLDGKPAPKSTRHTVHAHGKHPSLRS